MNLGARVKTLPGASSKEALAKVEALLSSLAILETFRAYPGESHDESAERRLGRSDYSGFSRLTKRQRRRRLRLGWMNESCRFTVPYCLNGGRLGRKMIAVPTKTYWTFVLRLR